MPIYNLRCKKCNKVIEAVMSVKDFIQFKKNINKCEACEGELIQHVEPVNNRVEKSLDQIKMDIKEEVKSIAKKIRQGDQSTIDDIFGDKPNENKNFGSYAEDEL